MGYQIKLFRVCTICTVLLGGHFTSTIGAQTQSDVGPTFSINAARLASHEPVLLTFSIKNETNVAVHYDLGRDMKEVFVFVVTLPNGETIRAPRLRKSGFSRIGDIRILPGQTYSQQILLNEWLDLNDQGRYEIAAGLAPPMRGGSEDSGLAQAKEIYRGSFEIGPRNEQALADACQRLALGIENASSYEQAEQFALELSYVKDPIAIPYLQRALLAKKLVEYFAIKGLERIGTMEAVEALSLGLAIQYHNTSVLTRAALQRISVGSTDPSIKEEIQKILKTP
jgi:hypothetical protein